MTISNLVCKECDNINNTKYSYCIKYCNLRLLTSEFWLFDQLFADQDTTPTTMLPPHAEYQAVVSESDCCLGWSGSSGTSDRKLSRQLLKTYCTR